MVSVHVAIFVGVGHETSGLDVDKTHVALSHFLPDFGKMPAPQDRAVVEQLVELVRSNPVL